MSLVHSSPTNVNTLTLQFDNATKSPTVVRLWCFLEAAWISLFKWTTAYESPPLLFLELPMHHAHLYSISRKPPVQRGLRYIAVLIYSMYPTLLASVLASRKRAANARHVVTCADLAGANLHQPGNVRPPWAKFVGCLYHGSVRWLETAFKKRECPKYDPLLRQGPWV